MNADPSSAPKLVILTGPEKGKELTLRPEDSIIGRTDEADLVIPDKSISRRHAGIGLRGGVWVVRDLESKNGVRVNNREVTEQGLRTGDLIMIGGVRMKFIDPRELAPVPPAAPVAAGPPAPLPDLALPAPPMAGPGAAPFPPVPPAPCPPPAPGPAAAAPPGTPAASPAIYTPKPQVQAEIYAPPPEFYAPKLTAAPAAPAHAPLTRGKVLLYLAVFGAVGLGLGFLVYKTFWPPPPPFQEDVSLYVDEVRLVDLVRYFGVLRSAKGRLEVSRLADVSYEADMGILRIRGKSLGHTQMVFADPEEKVIGSVGIHVMASPRRKYVDRMALTEEQRRLQALERLSEGESLSKAHIADAIKKYEEANYLLEGIDEPNLVSSARTKLIDMNKQREDRFARLKDAYRQANQLKDYPSALDILDEICRLYPDPSEEEHQRARIFMKRVQASAKAQQGRKKG